MWQPVAAEGCGIYMIDEVKTGDTSIVVYGAAGVGVTVYDWDSDEVLGSGTLSAASAVDACDASAEITLSTPVFEEQLLWLIGDDASDWLEWVHPEYDAWIEIVPVCNAPGDVNAIVYGEEWGDADISLFWDAQYHADVTPVQGAFAYLIEIADVTDGFYEVKATDGTSFATTMYQVPCGAGGPIEGLVFFDFWGAWLPIDDATVTLTVDGTSFVEETVSYADGYYFFDALYDEAYTLSACVAVEGQAYAAELTDVVPPIHDADLYLEAVDSAECSSPTPQEPPDLTIGTPTVTALSDTAWNVTVTISNTTDITVTQPFYVDAWTPHSDAFGYVSVPSLGAQASATYVIEMESEYPIRNEKPVKVKVDALDEIEERNETNNTANGTLSLSPTANVETVGVYLLAFDNPSYSAGNLAPQLPETLKGIVAATEGDTSKMAVVLADLDQDGDTHIMTVFDGDVTYIDGLPDATGEIDTAVSEYDMSDGETLGGFLLWANNNFPAPQTNLFVYAHGAPLAPATDISSLIGTPSRSARTPVPLPSWIFIHPDMTDMHPVGLLTPHDLGVALDVATQHGGKYAVVDLVHCFSLSIEEVHEVEPYAEFVTGSPNYAYFDAQLPGAALDAIDGDMDAETVADTILYTYDSLLPDSGYPRMLAAVDTFDVTLVKPFWDIVSAELLLELDARPNATRTKIAAAYASSPKYDTNYCEPDWELSSPDALVDMYDFAYALADQFGHTSNVGIFAIATADTLYDAVSSVYITEGVPDFTDIDNASYWAFDGLGVSMYADLAGVQRGGAQQLSWHADFYTKTISAENPHPYKFVTGDTTWADVFTRFWENETTTTEGCVRTFPPVRDTGELAIGELINPQANEAALNNPLLPSFGLETSGAIGHAIITFAIEQAGSVVYTDTIGTGRIFTGTQWIQASRAWTPSATGVYTLTVTVDPENYIDEANEADNQLVFVDLVSAESGTDITPNAAVANGQQWITDLSAPLTVEGSSRSAATQLAVTTYQFTQPQSGIGQPVARASTTLNTTGATVDLPLSGAIAPGPVQLHVWELDGDSETQLPATLRVNYVPANAPIALNELACYPFSAEAGDQIQMRLSVPNGDDANLFVWYPHSLNAPDLTATRSGDDHLRIDDAPLTGDYLLCVRGETASGTTYTLSVVENGAAIFTHPTTPENQASATVPASRPLFEQPLPQSTSLVPTQVALVNHAAQAPYALVLTLLMGVGLAAATRFAQQRRSID